VPNKRASRVSENREIAAIRKLILQGMKMLVESERQINETNQTPGSLHPLTRARLER